MSNRRPPAKSQPVLWWLLINEVEAFSDRYRMGLANVWTYIHRGDYISARDTFAGIKVPCDVCGKPSRPGHCNVCHAKYGQWLDPEETA